MHIHSMGCLAPMPQVPKQGNSCPSQGSSLPRLTLTTAMDLPSPISPTHAEGDLRKAAKAVTCNLETKQATVLDHQTSLLYALKR